MWTQYAAGIADRNGGASALDGYLRREYGADSLAQLARTRPRRRAPRRGVVAFLTQVLGIAGRRARAASPCDD